MRLDSPKYSSTAAFARTGITLLLPIVIAMTAQSPARSSETEKWAEYLKNGEENYTKQKWGHAEKDFSKAVRLADRSDVGDKNLALSLKKLGEANMAAKKYREAETHLQRAIKVAKDCGEEDPDAIRDLLELAKTYRSVNLEQFGKNVATVLKETGLDRIELLNTKDGKSRVIVRFADQFNKHITSQDVNQINIEKNLTFDIHEDKDGTITLSNIKGLRVHTKIWANLTHSLIDPHGNHGTPTALVTAEKLGLTKTVQTVLPKPVYDRILSVVERIKHPELHSPWHKQLQEHISATARARQQVPVTVTNTGNPVETGPQKPIDTTTTTEAGVTGETGKTPTIEAAKNPTEIIDPSTEAAVDAATELTNSTRESHSRQFAAGKPASDTSVTGDVITPMKN